MRFSPSSEFPRFAPSRHTFRHPLATQSLDTLDPPARHTLPFAPRNHTFRTAKPYILPCKTIRIAFRPLRAPSARPRFPPRKRAKTGFPHIAVHPARQHPQPLKRAAAGERKRRHRAPPFIIMVIGAIKYLFTFVANIQKHITMMIQITVKGLHFEVVDPNMHKLISFDKITLRNVYKSLFRLLGYECENTLTMRDIENELCSLDTVQLRCRIIDFILDNCDYPYSRLTVDNILFDTDRNDVVITPSAVLAYLK